MATATKEAERPVLTDRYHLENCPQPADRVEQYDLVRPARPAKGEAAKTVTVVRCIECGGQQVKEKD